jgi:hypothetical protein
MLPYLQFPWTMKLQAAAVHDLVHPVRTSTRLRVRHVQHIRPTRQGGVVRTGRSRPSRRMTKPINLSVWCSARRSTAPSVSALSMASGEYQGWPPRLVRGSARHAATASWIDQSHHLLLSCKFRHRLSPIAVRLFPVSGRSLGRGRQGSRGFRAVIPTRIKKDAARTGQVPIDSASVFQFVTSGLNHRLVELIALSSVRSSLSESRSSDDRAIPVC